MIQAREQSKTFVPLYQTTQRHTSGDSNLYSHRHVHLIVSHVHSVAYDIPANTGTAQSVIIYQHYTNSCVTFKNLKALFAGGL